MSFYAGVVRLKKSSYLTMIRSSLQKNKEFIRNAVEFQNNYSTIHALKN